MNTSSNWSTTSTARSPSSGSTRSSAASGCAPGRISARRQRSEPGSTPLASAGSRPARTAEDFPLPGRSDHGEEGRAHEPGDQLGHEPLAAEEVLRVGGVEGGEPEEGADRRQRRLVLVTPVEPAALVERPEGEQVAGEIGLGGAQLAALDGGAARARSGHP